jgi:hypothetical protein
MRASPYGVGFSLVKKAMIKNTKIAASFFGSYLYHTSHRDVKIKLLTHNLLIVKDLGAQKKKFRYMLCI